MKKAVRLHESQCRFLTAIGGRAGDPSSSFGQLLDQLDIHLPAGLGLSEMVELGWLRPQLRVRLPDSLFFAWKHYPLCQVPANLQEGDIWAWNLWHHVTNGIASRAKPPQIKEDWYRHFLDDHDDELRSVVLEHQLDPDEATPPPYCLVPKRSVIYPWIDCYGYWQVYRRIGECLSTRSALSPKRR